MPPLTNQLLSLHQVCELVTQSIDVTDAAAQLLLKQAKLIFLPSLSFPCRLSLFLGTLQLLPQVFNKAIQ